jgi:hypothetical protein
MSDSKEDLDQTKRLLGALLRMPPKPHDQMKIGKRRPKPILGKVDTKPTKAKKQT